MDRRGIDARDEASWEGDGHTECRQHGMTEFWLEGRGYYRCKRCRLERVSRRRRKVKQILVAEAGGCCALCGYDRCVAALHFHHLDPSSKQFHLSMHGAAARSHPRVSRRRSACCYAPTVTRRSSRGSRLLRRMQSEAGLRRILPSVLGSSIGRALNC